MGGNYNNLTSFLGTLVRIASLIPFQIGNGSTTQLSTVSVNRLMYINYKL